MADSNAPQSDAPQGKIRVQIDFSHKALKSLDEMQEVSKATSRVGVIRSALTLYRYLLMKKQEGYSVSIKLKKGDEVIESIIDL